MEQKRKRYSNDSTTTYLKLFGDMISKILDHAVAQKFCLNKEGKIVKDMGGSFLLFTVEVIKNKFISIKLFVTHELSEKMNFVFICRNSNRCMLALSKFAKPKSLKNDLFNYIIGIKRGFEHERRGKKILSELIKKKYKDIFTVVRATDREDRGGTDIKVLFTNNELKTKEIHIDFKSSWRGIILSEKYQQDSHKLLIDDKDSDAVIESKIDKILSGHFAGQRILA